MTLLGFSIFVVFAVTEKDFHTRELSHKLIALEKRKTNFI